MKKLSSFKEKMEPSKKISKTPKGKKVAGRNYSEQLDMYDSKDRASDNTPKSKPLDISGALKRSKEGYSKKPRVIADKKKGR